MSEGQMTQSTYLQIDACPARIDALEVSKADQTALAAETTAREAADAKHDAALVNLIDGGAKNLLEMTQTAETLTRYGVTCTYDKAAGTMTLTGSHAAADSSAIFEFYSGNAANQRVLPAGTYYLSGVPAGGSTSTYRASLTNITGGIDTGNGATFTLAEPKYAAYRILISGDCDFTGGYVFKPMICAKAAWDISDKFVPYCPTNAELYAMIRNGSAVSANSLRQTAQLTATPNDTETEGETK
jgi:hypothetical protein